MSRINMQALLASAVLAMLLVAAAVLPAMAQQTGSERHDLLRYQQFAEAPVAHVTYFEVDGFQYLAPDKVGVWFGVNKLYVLTVQTPCNNLDLANAIGLTSRNNVLYSNFDFVTFRAAAGDQRCKILKIVPVNERAMKQAGAKAKAAPGSD